MADSTTAMSDLQRDMVEEVLSRVPLTSLRAVRATCKTWNTLSKHGSFTKNHVRKSKAAMKKKKEFLAITIIDFKVYLLSIDLRGSQNYDDDDSVKSSIKQKGKLICNGDGVDISNVFHCSGLLLCLTKETISRLMVFNPYRRQTSWIETPTLDDNGMRNAMRHFFTLGYEKKKKNSRRTLKILRCIELTLRFIDSFSTSTSRTTSYEIYNFNSDSWEKVVGPPVSEHDPCVSLKGNTYWLRDGTRREPNITFGGWAPPIFQPERVPEFFLRCFDFTTESFGPCLSLPNIQPRLCDCVTISSVGDKQLALLYQKRDTLHMEIWITTMIEPTTLSWSKFLAVDMTPLISYYQFPFTNGDFLVDEEKKATVIFDKGKDAFHHTRKVAYIFGNDGYFEKVDLGGYTNKYYRLPFVCSYVPSSVKIS